MNQRSTHSNTVLWASAFVILALIITQAGRVVPANQAHAGLIAQSGDLTVLTADTGTDHEVVLLLDRFEGTLLVYTMKNRNTLALLQNYEVDAMLRNAAAVAGKSSP